MSGTNIFLEQKTFSSEESQNIELIILFVNELSHRMKSEKQIFCWKCKGTGSSKFATGLCLLSQLILQHLRSTFAPQQK